MERRKKKKTPREFTDIMRPSVPVDTIEDSPEPSSHVARMIFAFLGIAFIVAGSWVVLAYREYRELEVDALHSSEEISESPWLAAILPSLQSVLGEDVNLDGGVGTFSAFRDVLSLAVRGGVSAYGSAGKVLSSVLALTHEAEALGAKLPVFISGDESIVPSLESARDGLAAMRSGLEGISRIHVGKQVVETGSGIPALTAEIDQWIQGIDGILEWLEDPRGKRIVLFFQNSAEMRPTGGFWGSFAVVHVKEGKIASVDVFDVNEADRVRERLVIPPEPLQQIAGRWRIADANWFFDFPSSARKAMEFFNESDLLAEDSVDAVFAVTPRVMEDVLSLTGPVSVDGEVFDRDSFLQEIQKSVQEERADGNKYPKEILGMLVDALREKFPDIPSDVQEQMIPLIADWVSRRDFMMFVSDPDIARFLRSQGTDGGAFRIEKDFQGDYLAVVSANIGGGKTDLFVDQNVSFTSFLEEDGTVRDRVVITRAHGGGGEEESWYRVPAKTYMRAFVPAGAVLSDAKGGRTFAPPQRAYRSYGKDSDVVAEEAGKRKTDFSQISLFEAADKDAFATWFNTPLGESETVSLSYTRALPGSILSGTSYSFVLETQPGVTGSYKVEIHAPPGFIWRETGLSVYAYASDDPRGRETVVLTAEEI